MNLERTVKKLDHLDQYFHWAIVKYRKIFEAFLNVLLAPYLVHIIRFFCLAFYGGSSRLRFVITGKIIKIT